MPLAIAYRLHNVYVLVLSLLLCGFEQGPYMSVIEMHNCCSYLTYMVNKIPSVYGTPEADTYSLLSQGF